MSIITISRGSYSKGKEVAEKLAQVLGFECISREILLEASQQFNIPEIKLARAIHDAPSFFERFTYGKERYVAYIRAALLKHVQKDNVVYHGLAAPYFLRGIPHVLKVRILADLEDRVQEEVRREELSEVEARQFLKKDDQERRKWGLQVYGFDTWDPMLYDMVVHLQNLSADDAVQIILCALGRPCFQTTPQSQKILDDLALASRVQAALVEEFPTAKVEAREGKVLVDLKGSVGDREEVTRRVQRLASNAAGIEVQVEYSSLP